MLLNEWNTYRPTQEMSSLQFTDMCLLFEALICSEC